MQDQGTAFGHIDLADRILDHLILNFPGRGLPGERLKPGASPQKADKDIDNGKNYNPSEHGCIEKCSDQSGNFRVYPNRK
jgi:hypothetical protein